MYVVYEGEGVTRLPDFKWMSAPYRDEKRRQHIIHYVIRSFTIENPIHTDCGENYQVVLKDGEKIRCYYSDHKLIEYHSRKYERILK